VTSEQPDGNVPPEVSCPSVHHASRETEMASALVELAYPSGLLCRRKRRRNCEVRSDSLALSLPSRPLPLPVGSSGSSALRSTVISSNELRLLPSWAWPLLQSAVWTAEPGSLLTRLSWDSFSRALPPT